LFSIVFTAREFFHVDFRAVANCSIWVKRLTVLVKAIQEFILSIVIAGNRTLVQFPILESKVPNISVVQANSFIAIEFAFIMIEINLLVSRRSDIIRNPQMWVDRWERGIINLLVFKSDCIIHYFQIWVN